MVDEVQVGIDKVRQNERKSEQFISISFTIEVNYIWEKQAQLIVINCLIGKLVKFQHGPATVTERDPQIIHCTPGVWEGAGLGDPESGDLPALNTKKPTRIGRCVGRLEEARLWCFLMVHIFLPGCVFLCSKTREEEGWNIYGESY